MNSITIPQTLLLLFFPEIYEYAYKDLSVEDGAPGELIIICDYARLRSRAFY